MIWLLACTGPTDSDPAATPPTTDTDSGDTDDTDDTDPPSEYRPDAVGEFTVIDTFVDTGPRPARVFRPETEGAVPVVVLLHGFQLQPGGYTSTATHFASHGYVVVAPRMSGTLFNPTSHAALSLEIEDVIDWIASDPPEIGANGPQLILAGHSLGGKIATLRATEDDRVDALFLIDPVDANPPFGSNPTAYPSVTPERMGQVTVPLLALGETTNTTGIQPCAPAQENFERYVAHAPGPALAVEIVGADHMSFLDDPDCGFTCDACPDGPTDPAAVRSLTRTVGTAFLDATTGDASAFEWLNDFLVTAESAGDVVLSGAGL